jgi:hypothetical protein
MVEAQRVADDEDAARRNTTPTKAHVAAKQHAAEADADANAARLEFVHVFAEKRRQEALSAARNRHAAQAALVEGNKTKADQVHAESMAAAEQALVLRVEDDLRRRTRTEQVRVHAAAAAAPIRLQHTLFTPKRAETPQPRATTSADTSTLPMLSLTASAADKSNESTDALSLLLAAGSPEKTRSTATERHPSKLSPRSMTTPTKHARPPSGLEVLASLSTDGQSPWVHAIADLYTSSQPRARHVTAASLSAAKSSAAVHATVSSQFSQAVLPASIGSASQQFRRVIDNPSQKSVDALKRSGRASAPLLTEAERLLTLIREHDDMQRAVHLRNRDELAVRRDAARAASAEPVRRTSPRLTERTLLQDAARANVLAVLAAEKVALTAGVGEETIASRHVAHGPVRGCSPTLYDTRKIDRARQVQAQKALVAEQERNERVAKLYTPMPTWEQQRVKKLYDVQIRRQELLRSQAAKAEEQRFAEATLADQRVKLTADQLVSSSVRLTHSSTRRKSPRPLPKKALDAEGRMVLSGRVYAGALEQQRAENERLAHEYLPPLCVPKRLDRATLQEAAERLHGGKRA